MSPKEIVSEGLEARANARAAEANAETFKKMADDARDELFRDRLNHDRERNAWESQRRSLLFRIMLKDDLIDQQRQELHEMRQMERDAARIRFTLRLVKCIMLFALLIVVRDMGLIVPWLVNWLVLATICELTVTTFNLVKITKY